MKCSGNVPVPTLSVAGVKPLPTLQTHRDHMGTPGGRAGQGGAVMGLSSSQQYVDGVTCAASWGCLRCITAVIWFLQDQNAADPKCVGLPRQAPRQPSDTSRCLTGQLSPALTPRSVQTPRVTGSGPHDCSRLIGYLQVLGCHLFF